MCNQPQLTVPLSLCWCFYMYSTAGWTEELPKLEVVGDLDLLRQQQKEVTITRTARRPPIDCAKFAKINSGRFKSLRINVFKVIYEKIKI